ncbi:UNVERIFIED_CONTAM: hypothetical protein FKN15_077157 [Acipenser sinensis]
MRRNSRCRVCLPNPREHQSQCNAPFGVPCEDRPPSHSQDANLHCMTHPAHHEAALLPEPLADQSITCSGSPMDKYCTVDISSDMDYHNFPHGSGDTKIQWVSADPTTKPGSFFTQERKSRCQRAPATSGGQGPALQVSTLSSLGTCPAE